MLIIGTRWRPPVIQVRRVRRSALSHLLISRLRWGERFYFLNPLREQNYPGQASAPYSACDYSKKKIITPMQLFSSAFVPDLICVVRAPTDTAAVPHIGVATTKNKAFPTAKNAANSPKQIAKPAKLSAPRSQISRTRKQDSTANQLSHELAARPPFAYVVQFCTKASFGYSNAAL